MDEEKKKKEELLLFVLDQKTSCSEGFYNSSL